ncbi:Sialic acid-binding Ig-like lectin 12 [Liparis tanakae]|uniref:Sialic acid-binding Ig-like lectin 12 n=1 Tax=Liparis tanakae TaxID=230148 RepID=A0A4Z2HSP4_9TELE|nr:Sialic acid-binding Ig-like lectin 12 [Liparis tanakae]
MCSPAGSHSAIGESHDCTLRSEFGPHSRMSSLDQMKLMGLVDLTLILILASNSKGQSWNISVTKPITATKGSNVTIKCTFTVPAAQSTPSVEVYWKKPERSKFKTFDNDRNAFVFHPNDTLVLEKYRGKTKLIGNKINGDCSLKICGITDNVQNIYVRVIAKGDNYSFRANSVSISVSVMALKLCLSFLLLHVIHVQSSHGQWLVNIPSRIPVVQGSCVVIPCSFAYPRPTSRQVLNRRTNASISVCGCESKSNCPLHCVSLLSNDSPRIRLEPIWNRQRPVKVAEWVAVEEDVDPDLSPSTHHLQPDVKVQGAVRRREAGDEFDDPHKETTRSESTKWTILAGWASAMHTHVTIPASEEQEETAIISGTSRASSRCVKASSSLTVSSFRHLQDSFLEVGVMKPLDTELPMMGNEQQLSIISILRVGEESLVSCIVCLGSSHPDPEWCTCKIGDDGHTEPGLAFREKNNPKDQCEEEMHFAMSGSNKV